MDNLKYLHTVNGKGLVEIKCPYSIQDTVPTVDNLKYLHTVNGKGLVEIKCPYSIRDTVPTVDNLKYLHTVNGKVQLKQNTEYFYQKQGQMGATGRKYCYLFILTCHGHLVEKIDFNPAFWEDMLLKLDWFWHNYLCPELLYQTIKQKQQEESQHKLLSPTSTTDVKELPSSKSNKSSMQFLSSVPVSHSVAVSSCRNSAKAVQPCSFVSTRVSQSRKANQKTKKATKTASRKKIKTAPVYCCGTCTCVCVENPKQYSEHSIECSGCSLWFHFQCEVIKEENIPKGKWLCKKCK